MREWLPHTMSSRRFRFGLFEFDAEALELRREGVLVRLQSQPAHVLACLIERADQVVSREDLRRIVWGEETFVDFELGLNFCVSQIRSALRDDSAEPVYIRTVPKKGYQFIAPVKEISEQPGPIDADGTRGSRYSFPVRAATFFLVVVPLAILALLVYRLRPLSSASSTPTVAVLRFDNETSDPNLTIFSDALTDNIVEQLTSRSSGNYQVIGNAQILRVPRQQRDLRAIASSLHSSYVVLGQVQSKGPQVRILAHLIHLPDQKHIWVTRLDRSLEDPLNVESQAASKIASEFSALIAAKTIRAVSSLPSSH